jgi:hypothetical protein
VALRQCSGAAIPIVPHVELCVIVTIASERASWGFFVPRFYFDLTDDQTIHDRKGVTLPNIQEARKYAITFARELMESKSTLLGESPTAWSIRITDGKFQKLMTIPFTEVLGDSSASGLEV